MKSLVERKKQRELARAEALKESPFAEQYAQEAKEQKAVEDQTEALEVDISKMTIDELKGHALKLGTEVPAEKVKKDEIFEFVNNLVQFKKNESAPTGNANGNGGGTWNAGN